MTIKMLPPEERPREKLFLNGAEFLSNTELLAVLLRTGTKSCSAVGLAEKILSYDKEGLTFLAGCLPAELLEINGVGKAKACQIVAAMELGKRVAVKPKKDKVCVDNPEAVVGLFMEEMRYHKKEVFNTMVLNAKGEILCIEKTSVGDLSSTVIHPREAFLPAIRRSGASVIFVHNHPSGNPEPSKEDISITNRLVESGKILGINVLDHIIIGDGTYTSFKDKDLI